MICTEMDVIEIVSQIYDIPADFSKEFEPLMRLDEIRKKIGRSDSKIFTALKQIYGTGLTCTPWTEEPTIDKRNVSKDDFYLKQVTATSSAVSELWIITFTSDTAFTIKSGVTKVSNTGDTSTAYSNDYLEIAKADWIGTPNMNDIVYVQTYDYEIQLVEISALYAAAACMDSIFTQEVPNASEYAKVYREQADAIIKELIDPKHPRTLIEHSRAERDIEPIEMEYDIDHLGRDQTDYAEEEV